MFIVMGMGWLLQHAVLGTGCALLSGSCVNSTLHPYGVAKSSTGLGWGKCGNVISAGWQVTLCDHVTLRSGEAGLLTKGESLYRVHLLTHFT